ncbi:MAG TPA: hypothetical protein PLD15_06195 [Mesotoga sp.]|nr:hypothetical protein [Mesotoga sp.]
MLELDLLLLAESHDTDCRCPVCFRFWQEEGPSEIDDNGVADYGPFTTEEIEAASLERLLQGIDMSGLQSPNYTQGAFDYLSALARVPELSATSSTLGGAEHLYARCDYCDREGPDVTHRVIERGSNVEEAWLCDDCYSDART